MGLGCVWDTALHPVASFHWRSSREKLWAGLGWAGDVVQPLCAPGEGLEFDFLHWGSAFLTAQGSPRWSHASPEQHGGQSCSSELTPVSATNWEQLQGRGRRWTVESWFRMKRGWPQAKANPIFLPPRDRNLQELSSDLTFVFWFSSKCSLIFSLSTIKVPLTRFVSQTHSLAARC